MIFEKFFIKRIIQRWYSQTFSELTGSEVDDDIYEEDGVRQTVEGDPARTQVVVEEGYRDWQDDEVGHQEEEHTKVPIKSGRQRNIYINIFT